MTRVMFLGAATVAALAVLVGLPMSFVALQAVFPHLAQGSLREPFSPLVTTLADPVLTQLLGSTLNLGLGVMLVAGALGIPLGALRGLFRVPLARTWDLLFLVPFLIPPYIAALSWTLALQPRGYMEQLVGVHLGELLFSLGGMVLVMGLGIFPVVYFAVSRSMAATGGRLAEVAQVFGATPWRAFLRVSLPLALPAMAASLLLAFTLAIEEYGVPAALGSQSGVTVLTTGIERRLADWPIDMPGAAVLSLVLVALALTAFFVQRAVVAGRDFETTTGKPVVVPVRSLGRWRWPVTVAFGAVAFAAVGVPLFSMVATAVSGTISGGLSWGNLSSRHLAALVDTAGEAWQALGTSLMLATGSALLAGAVGFMAAWCVAGRKVPGAAAIDALSLLPAALPGIVVGVGLILAWNQPFWPVTPYGTWGILLLSYVCLLLPYPVRYVGAALTQIGANLEAAARVHGATPAAALRRIVLPLALPSLVASMLMVFAVASRELVTSLLLAPAGVQTVSIYVWRQFEQGSPGQGMAMACLAVTVSLSVMGAALWLNQAAAGRRR